MEISDRKLSTADLQIMADHLFGNLVKAVVDIERRIIAVDAELHADEESLLLEYGSQQEDLWGINLYPEFGRESDDLIEFDSMVNLRPSQNNQSRGVDDPLTREKISDIVREWIV